MYFSSKPFGRRAAISSITRATRRSPGFTLLEILVVLAIIGLLAGLAITNVDKIFGTSQVGIAKLAVSQTFKTSLTTYRIHMGSYPTTQEGLQALITAPQGKTDKWHGPYLSETKLPRDPWEEPYQYQYPGTRNKDTYDLWSKGPDRQSGTADDVGNWDSGTSAEK